MGMRVGAMIAAGVGVVALAACSLAVSLDGLTGGEGTDGGGVGPDGATDAPAPLDAPSASDAPDAADANEGGLQACPGDAGPAMVDVGHFCIDATEVTNADYAAFLAALDGGLAPQPPFCAWATTMTPSSGWPPPAGTDTLPVVFVDWCEAYEYCAWAGKHLCGALDGGPADPNNPSAPQSDRWYYACSNVGALAYPYGQAYEPLKCNGFDYDDGGGLLRVASTGCEGGFVGIFDMSGNAEEWEDSCSTYTADAGDICLNRGGSFDESATELTCASSQSFNTRNFTSDHTGFRCCSP
jgi:formylglycine-generating enzyme required for sulfatase activity